ncbi:MAG: PAS domain S-box protein [Pseudomonadota bacterium]
MNGSLRTSIVVHDADGNFLYANQRALDMHGYSRDEFMAITLHRITVPASEKLIDARIQEIFDRGETSFEVEHLKKNGTILPLWINVKKVTWGGKSVFLSVQTDITERKRIEAEREKLVRDLQKALSEVKTLKGIFPICASCKKIRDDKGYWKQIEVYIRDHSEAEFSHGICPDCMKKLYPDFEVNRENGL